MLIEKMPFDSFYENFCKKFFSVDRDSFDLFFQLMKNENVDEFCRKYFLTVALETKEMQQHEFEDFKHNFQGLLLSLPNGRIFLQQNQKQFEGLKVLYGLSGSGKTTRALSLQSKDNYNILSTDGFLKFLRENSEILGREPFNILAANNNDFRLHELKTVFCLFLSGMLSNKKLALDFGGAVMNQNLARMLCYYLLSEENIEKIEISEEQRRKQLLFDTTNPKGHARSILIKGFNDLKFEAEKLKQMSEFTAAIIGIRTRLQECNKRDKILQKRDKQLEEINPEQSSREFVEPTNSQPQTKLNLNAVKKYEKKLEKIVNEKADADTKKAGVVIEIMEKEKKAFCKSGKLEKRVGL